MPFAMLNANKKSVTLDLKSAADKLGMSDADLDAMGAKA